MVQLERTFRRQLALVRQTAVLVPVYTCVRVFGLYFTSLRRHSWPYLLSRFFF